MRGILIGVLKYFAPVAIPALVACAHSLVTPSRHPDAAVTVAAQHPILPHPGGTGALNPWGGADSSQWRSEAIIANAFSSELNRAWAEPGVRDVLVALPVRIFPSSFAPYGDGQTNANPSFEGWKTKTPPLIATLTWYLDSTRAPKVTFRYNGAFGLQASGYDQLEISYRAANGESGVVNLPGRYDGGDLIAEWTAVPQALGWDRTIHEGVAFVRPSSSRANGPVFGDSLPIYFRHPVKTTDQLLNSVKQQISGFFAPDLLNRALVPDRAGLKLTGADKALQAKITSLDPSRLSLNAQERMQFDSAITRLDFLMEKVRIDNPGISQSMLDFYRRKFQTILTDGRPSVLKKALFFFSWPNRYNAGIAQLPYMPLNIHGDFPAGSLRIQTGVGMGWTWVQDQDAPFKIMYTCFERRDAPAEASANLSPPYPAGEVAGFGRTVASGGGWHRIGDNQETIMNTVEEGAALVASGFSSPASRIGFSPSRGSVAYGLSDIVVARFLQPGEGFITVKQGNRVAGPDLVGNYHWYAFQQDTEVCTEEWVHLDGDPKTPNLLN